MAATGEFYIFHIGTGSFQRSVCRTRTLRRNHIVGISVKDTEIDGLGSFQSFRIHRTTNRYGSSKDFRKTDGHVKGTHSTH